MAGEKVPDGDDDRITEREFVPDDPNAVGIYSKDFTDELVKLLEDSKTEVAEKGPFPKKSPKGHFAPRETVLTDVPAPNLPGFQKKPRQVTPYPRMTKLPDVPNPNIRTK